MKESARYMLAELDHRHLTVGLIPARYGTGKVRIVHESNPCWYRQLCAAHQRRRTRRSSKSDTKIKREWVRKALLAIINGEQFPYYRAEIESLVRDY